MMQKEEEMRKERGEMGKKDYATFCFNGPVIGFPEVEGGGGRMWGKYTIMMVHLVASKHNVLKFP